MFSEVVGEDNGVRDVVAVLGVDIVSLLVVLDPTSTDVEVDRWVDPCECPLDVDIDVECDKTELESVLTASTVEIPKD